MTFFICVYYQQITSPSQIYNIYFLEWDIEQLFSTTPEDSHLSPPIDTAPEVTIIMTFIVITNIK
jgi:hypothetical protein